MEIHDIAAGVATGILIAVGMIWCFKHMDRKDEENIPLWALGGALLGFAYIAASFYLASSRLPQTPPGQSATEYHQESPASDRG